MKRIAAAITLLALLLALAGCAGGIDAPKGGTTMTPAPANTPGTASEKPVTSPEAPGPTARAPENGDPGQAPAALVRAVYPETIPYPDEMSDSYSEDRRAWQDGLRAARAAAQGSARELEPYLRASLTEFLSGAGAENRVVAPMNIYMCLAMLAEVTDGQSRAQVLELLGEKDIAALRARAKAIWNAEYRDDALVTCLLASSLWLNDRVDYHPETLERLAETYYASGFRGVMGSPEYDRMLQDWLNEQTGGLLENQVSNLSMDARTVLALATTIYFKAPWTNKFSAINTYAQTFHAPGGDRETDFLHKDSAGDYFWGENFSAVPLELESAGTMWFILPDEGYAPRDLLAGEALDFILSPEKYAWDRQKHLVVHFAAPRFDVSSDLDLVSGLKDLGLRDVFDMDASDFTPLTELDQIYVSQARHAARVTIDEEGCTGAAYTVMMMAAGAVMAPQDEVDFIADRPFLFLVTGADGLPLFAGIVNSAE